MIEYKLVGKKMHEEWDLLATHPLQSYSWGEFRAGRQPITRLGVLENEKLVRGFLIVWTKIWKTPYYFGYVPMGPVPTKEDLRQIDKVGRDQGALGIRMEPHRLKGEITDDQFLISNMVRGRNLFKPKTYWWDLTQSAENLLKNMHQKARYNIKVAIRHHVKIFEDNEGKYFDKYLELLFKGTVTRQKVSMHNTQYQTEMWKILSKARTAKLFAAEYSGEVVSVIMIFFWKDRAYYAYGANSLKYKEVMAPTLLLWESAKKIKAEGYKIFDLWGAETGTGFSRFKEQFGAELVEMSGTYDLPIANLGYRAFRIVEELRWRLRH